MESIDLLACLHYHQSSYHSVSDITIVSISIGQCATHDNSRENQTGELNSKNTLQGADD